jgi:hypothetical protein
MAAYSATQAVACGLPANNFAPSSFLSAAETAAGNNEPNGWKNCCGHTDANWISDTCVPMLMYRGFIYFKKVAGDCGVAGSPIDFDAESEQIASGIANVSNIALPGIGSAISAIAGIFGAAHAQAVQTEETTICQVTLIINQVIPYYDGQVRSGKISPTTAYKGLQSYFAYVAAQLKQIMKTECDAACVYIGILNAHAAFAAVYYPAIAPSSAFSIAPGSAPIVSSTPGGVISASVANSGNVAGSEINEKTPYNALLKASGVAMLLPLLAIGFVLILLLAVIL